MRDKPGLLQDVEIALAEILGVDLGYCAPEARPIIRSRQVRALIAVLEQRLVAKERKAE